MTEIGNHREPGVETGTSAPVLQELQSLRQYIKDKVVFSRIQTVYTDGDASFRSLLMSKIEANKSDLSECADNDADPSELVEEIIAQARRSVRLEWVKTEAIATQDARSIVGIEKQEQKSTTRAHEVTRQIASVTSTLGTATRAADLAAFKKEQQDLTKKVDQKMVEMNQHLQDTYALFGDKQGFEEKFAGRMKEWRAVSEAEVDKQAAKTGIQLTHEERESRIQTSIIISQHDVIARELSGEQRQRFNGIVWDLTQISHDLWIPQISPPHKHPGYIRPDQDDINGQLIRGASADSVVRVGDTFYSGDQILDMSVRPPHKYIESNGIRIETTARYEDSYENLARIDVCQSEKVTLESSVRARADGFGKVAKSIFPNRPDLASLDTSDPNRFRTTALDLRESLRKHFSQMIESGELSNEADQKVAKRIMESISQEVIEETVKQIERIRELERMIAALRAADERRIPEYQERVRTQDEIGRANLAYLSSLRLGVLGQDNFQQFIDLVNAHRGQLMGGMVPELNLSEPFGVEEKRLIARAFGRMLGGDDLRIFQDPPQEYELRRFALDADQTAIDDEYVRGKLRAGNPPMMDQMGQLHVVALEAALQGVAGDSEWNESVR